MIRYRNGKISRGPRIWEPLSTQYPKEFKTWRGLIMRKYLTQEPYTSIDPLFDEDILNDFEVFLSEVGPAFSNNGIECSLDRKDNTKGYVKGNIRWATRSEQMLNRNSNGKEKHFYQGKDLREWERITGTCPTVVRWRIQNGWPVDKAILTPKS